ncbi:MAG TPA: DNA-binding protein YbiB [Burkholderiaceae bacterium]|nr:DNA-binding protein YbiB [Burkholderiaceae bacterium]
MTFPVAPLLRELGRGKKGSRALTREQAHELFAAILDGAVGELELGGVLIALRMKGETAPEIAGFLDALQPQLMRVHNERPCVVIPTYNGARQMPNLVPLLALALAREGVPVLIHGQHSEPATAVRPRVRVTTLEILQALDIESCASVDEAPRRWAAEEPAFLPLEAVAPSLSRLIALRRRLGVRNVAHTLAKLIAPTLGPSLLLSCYTHPEFGQMLGELFALTGTAALSMRGTEGEAVANARRPRTMERWVHGTMQVVGADENAPEVELPAPDAHATAAWTRDVLAQRVPMPGALSTQIEIIRQTLALL